MSLAHPSAPATTAIDRFVELSEPLPLPAGTIDLIFADLSLSPAWLGELFWTLSREERERAERFRFDTHRRRYVARRGLLRWLLGRHLGLRPADVALDLGPQGKPCLAASAGGDAPSDERLEFNLSDSEDMALYAFARGFEVGVDLEHLREMPDAHSIAQNFFSPEEQDVLARLPDHDVNLSFFQCWTRKEAFVKATGIGIGGGIGDFSVTQRPGEPARLLRVQGKPAEAECWTLRHLTPAIGYVGAVACRRLGVEVRGFRWQPPRR